MILRTTPRPFGPVTLMKRNPRVDRNYRVRGNLVCGSCGELSNLSLRVGDRAEVGYSRSPAILRNDLCVESPAAAARIVVGFFGLGILAPEISERNVKRLVPEPGSDRPYAGPLHLASG